MKNKDCSKCKKNKPTSEFNKRRNAKDGLQYHCRSCEKLNHKADYSKNKEAYVKRARANTKKYIAQYTEYKKQFVCTLCGEDDPICIDFHHLNPKKKDINISTLASTSGLTAKVLKEIKKCLAVCGNCHRKIHKYGLKLATERIKSRINALVAER